MKQNGILKNENISIGILPLNEINVAHTDQPQI